MKIKNTPFQNAFIIEPEPFRDSRGSFSRIYCQDELRNILFDRHIVQINHSRTSQNGAIRGMHFQYPPMAEIKMIKCIRGEIYDVIIDVRRDSSTFLQWYGEVLSEENMKMVYVPEGFAHGFQTLKDNSELLYLHTEFYNPCHEGGIRFNDPAINIAWPLAVTDISKRDLRHPMVSHDFKGIKV